MKDVLTMIETALIVLLGVAPLSAVVGTTYLWIVYLSDPARPRSWLIRMLATSSTVLTVSVLYIGFLALYRLLGYGEIPDPYIILLSLDLFIISQVPAYKAWRIYRAAHGGSRPTIPVNGSAPRHDREGD